MNEYYSILRLVSFNIKLLMYVLEQKTSLNKTKDNRFYRLK